LRELGVELLKGEVRGVVKGEAYVRGEVYEYTYVEGPVGRGARLRRASLHLRAPRHRAILRREEARDEAKNTVCRRLCTRKQHGGYLGDSYVAPFVNLGAGTTVSNLKNTLGAIRPSYSAKSYRKLGPVIGEFVKTAIGTLIYGGKYVGPLSHLYGVVDRDVPPLSIYRGGEAAPMDREKAKEYIRRDLAQFGREDLYSYYVEKLVEKPLL
jgi:hypothetical protein